MASRAALKRQVDVLVTKQMSSAQVRHAVGNAVRKIRDEAISSGQLSGNYSTVVDGRVGADEDTIRLDGGYVTYIFSVIAQATNYALSECRKRSPVRSGSFRKSWAILVDGAAWDGHAASIQSGAQVTIVNTMPYARKIETAGQRVKVPPKIVEDVRQVVQRKYQGRIRAEKQFVTLQGGRDARGGALPYVLKQGSISSGLSWKKKAGWERKHMPYASKRQDRQAGAEMTYPALILREET